MKDRKKKITFLKTGKTKKKELKNLGLPGPLLAAAAVMRVL